MTPRPSLSVIYFTSLLCSHSFVFVLFFICDPLSQNEHKVATAAIQNYYRFIFFIIQAWKWHMICGYSSLFCLAKINILCWFSFVFYCSVTGLTGYISVYKLATLRSFCGSRSQYSLSLRADFKPLPPVEGRFHPLLCV